MSEEKTNKKEPAYIFIDTEYCWTCAIREGMIPNYRSIVEFFNETYGDNVKFAYLVGAKGKKKTVADFLVRIGINYVQILELQNCSKTQVIGTTIALDLCQSINFKSEYVFLTADDYMIPIVDYLNKLSIVPFIHYFPIIISKELNNTKCNLKKISNSYLSFSKKSEHKLLPDKSDGFKHD